MEDTLDCTRAGCDHLNCTPLPASGSHSRRLSAAGLASSLKTRALIEARPPLTRLSFSERPSIFDPDISLDLNSPPSSSTPLHRKRKMSSDSDNSNDGKRQKSKQDNASLLLEIRDLIKGSEDRTMDRFDKKIDLLSDNLTKRLDSTERDVKRLGRNVKEVKGDLLAVTDKLAKEKQELPDLIEKIVVKKVGN